MHNKLIAAGAGLFGYGAYLGWAITADFFENKMHNNQKILGQYIERQGRDLTAARELAMTNARHADAITDEPLPAAVDTIPNSGTPNPEDEAPDVMTEALSRVVIPEGGRVASPGTSDSTVIPEGETPEETQARLQSMIETYTGTDEDPFDVRTRAKEDMTPPYIISKEQYAWDEEGDDHQKSSLTFYPGPNILVDDEDQEPVEEADAIIGLRSLQMFGHDSGDPDTVFVRNRKLNTDFEIVRDTENPPPIHIRYGIGRDEYARESAADTLRFRQRDV